MQTRERLNTLIGIRPSESDSTSLMIAHSFFMGMSMVFFETAASALFLAHYDAGALPWVYLAATAVSITTGLTYTRIKDRVAFAPLMTGTLLILFASVCLLRLGLGLAQTGWLIFAMMVAYRLLSILTDLSIGPSRRASTTSSSPNASSASSAPAKSPRAFRARSPFPFSWA